STLCEPSSVLDSSPRGERFSLSPRERAGVRGERSRLGDATLRTGSREPLLARRAVYQFRLDSSSLTPESPGCERWSPVCPTRAAQLGSSVQVPAFRPKVRQEHLAHLHRAG